MKEGSAEKATFGWIALPRGRVPTVLPGRFCSLVTRRSDSHLSVSHKDSVHVTIEGKQPGQKAGRWESSCRHNHSNKSE